MASRQDNREYDRVEAEFRVRSQALDRLADLKSADLSKGGLFLATKKLLPLNAVIRLYVELPDGGGDVAVICRVAHVRGDKEAGPGKPTGLGVQFLDLGGDRLERIEKFLRARRNVDTTRPGTAAAPPGIQRPLRVMVVDDEDLQREHVAGALKKRGHTIRTAGNGVEALSACLKEPPDVIVTDLNMPKMDGWEFIRVVRSRPTLASTPIAVLTVVHGDDERLKLFELGANEYMTKPFDEADLIARVERLVTHAPKTGPEIGARSSLRGDLTQMSIDAVVTLLEMSRKTGVLFLVGDRTARLYIRQGRPIRAEIEGASGPSNERVYEILSWTRGQFEFASQDVAGDDEIGLGATGLLLEHARRIDEANRPDK